MKYLVLSFCLLLALACSKEEKNDCLQDCQEVSGVLRLNIIDHESNKSYLSTHFLQLADTKIKIYSTRLKRDLPYNIDPKTNYITFNITGSDEIYVGLGDDITDTIKVETKYLPGKCCGSIEISRLYVNDTFISKPQDYIIVIRK